MRLRFILAEVWTGLRRNVAMATAVVIVTFVSLTFVGGAVLLQRQIDTVKDYWYDRVQVSIFLCSADSQAPTCVDGAADEAVRSGVRRDLESSRLAPYIDRIYHESKEEAFARFQEQFPDEAVTNQVTAEQMPESYRVKLVDPQDYQVVAEYFAGREGVEQVSDQRQLLERFFKILNYLTIGSVILAGVMLLAAALLVSTTIRLAALSRRREISIMRLVGASSVLISTPFVLEAMIAVLFGALLAIGALYAFVHLFVVRFLTVELPVFNYIDTAEVWLAAPILVGVGMLLAVAASLVSLTRYLRV